MLEVFYDSSFFDQGHGRIILRTCGIHKNNTKNVVIVKIGKKSSTSGGRKIIVLLYGF